MKKIFETRFGNKEIEMTNWKGGEIPSTVYKYRDWNNNFHRKILLQQQIYIPSPEEFNDPFDCKIPIAYHLLQKNRKLEIEYITNFVERNNPSLSTELKTAKIESLLLKGNYKNPATIVATNAEIQTYIKENAGIYCVTPVNDNILMWSHYSNNHTGFCVGFDSTKLFNCFHDGQLVHYENDFPIISPVEGFSSKWNKIVFSKSNMWDYEIEYRLSKLGKPKSLFTIPKNAITQVIVGYKMPESDIIDIKKIVKHELPETKLFITKPKERNFEIEIIPL